MTINLGYEARPSKQDLLNYVSETYGNLTEEFSKPFVWRVNQKKLKKLKKSLNTKENQMK